MDKPVILTIDDDPAVLQTISRDLRKQYGERFRIVRADSGATALEAAQQLKLRGNTEAIFREYRSLAIAGRQIPMRYEIFSHATRSPIAG